MPYPIVLAHGIARFDVISPLTKYWNFIPDLLERIGIPVFEAADVEWVGSVRKRSKQLAERVEEVLDISGSDKVNLIGHSMGGLDCRRAIVLEGLADKVASLTALGSPHHGSPFADWMMAHKHADTISKIQSSLGLDLTGLSDLTTEACKGLNKELDLFEEENENNILYQTYAGKQDFDDIFWPLLPSYRIIEAAEGPNDGLVHISSAMWKPKYFKGVKDWDHLNFLGWWELAELDIGGGGRTKAELEREVKEFYLKLASELPGPVVRTFTLGETLMPNKYPYDPIGEYKDGDLAIGTENPTVRDVKQAFEKINPLGDYLRIAVKDKIPPGRYEEAFGSPASIKTHFQGVQRLRDSQYLVFSGGDAREKESQLFLVKMGTRKKKGAWRSNLLSGNLSTADRIESVVRIMKKRWHAGGISMAGDILAVPIYSTGKEINKIHSSVLFYNLKNGKQPKQFRQTSIERPGEKAGAVAIIKINNRFLVAVWSDADDAEKNKDLRPRLDFYLSDKEDLFSGFSKAATWYRKDVKAAPGQKPTFDKFQTIHFVLQEDNKLFLVGMHNTGKLSGRDFADLYRIHFKEDSVFKQSPSVEIQKVEKVANQRFTNDLNFQFNMDAAAGLYIDKNDTLRVYSSHYWIYDDMLRFNEFGPDDDTVAGTIDNTQDSWVELYNDDSFKGRRFSLRDIETGKFRDFSKVYVQGGDFEDCVSSARFQIPQGWVYRLYGLPDHKGRYIDLVGSGKILSVKNFTKIKLGNIVRSDHKAFKDKQQINFGDRVTSAEAVEV